MCALLRKFYLVCFWLVLSECSNILVVFPHYGKSHFLLYEDLFRKLASRGHNLSVISYFTQKIPLQNYRDVPLRLKTEEGDMGLSFNDMMPSRFKYYGGISILNYYTDKYCVAGFESEELWSFFNENIKFDVLLLQMFNSDCFMGFAEQFQAPVIGIHFHVFLHQ